MPTPRRKKSAKVAKPAQAESYQHPESTLPLRPDVGTQPQFKKKKPAQRYRYDSSLSPALEWDGESSAREEGEALIAQIQEYVSGTLRVPLENGTRSVPDTLLQSLIEAADKLRALSRPFLNWSGKAERLSFDVPTLPLFVHERLSTKAIIETLTGHKRDRQKNMFDLFGDPAHSVTDQVLRAYEYQDQWVNRMVLGDSLVVMNSLLRYESLGGQVQMIYMDPPYGVKFGSNFQPFVRKRDVKHGDDDDLTREPEMVQAYRDTWELGLHSYLSYMRDRLLLCRELLAPSGSVFVQISDENVHHVREVMDEVFGAENAISQISFKKTTGQTSRYLSATADYLLWYGKEIERSKFRPLYTTRVAGDDEAYSFVELPDGTRRRMTPEEQRDPGNLGRDLKVFRYQLLQSQRQGRPSGPGTAMHFPITFEGRTFTPSGNRGWTTTADGMERLKNARRLAIQGNSLSYVRYLNDFPATQIHALWMDTQSGSAMDKLYVVQTNNEVIRRCLLMTTDPGDLVFDPTCGSGTTPYVAEQWGRRWITADVSRVPLALARQRLLTATFPWHQLKDEDRGPAGGFVYKRKQNKKGEEVGGIVPHVTLKSIANNEPPAEEVLVDRPEAVSGITRVSGPFTFEASIPTAADWEAGCGEQGAGSKEQGAGSREQGVGSGEQGAGSREQGVAGEATGFTDRMLEILRKSPLLQLGGNKTVKLTNIRPPAKTLSLSAEALVVPPSGGAGVPPLGGNGGASERGDGPPKGGTTSAEPPKGGTPAALVFGPETAAVSEKLVYNAAKEALAKNYAHLYVIGFAIQPNARALVEECEAAIGIAATYVQATPDLLMGDLLKNMRSSQIFSVCGLPEVAVRRTHHAPRDAATAGGANGPIRYEVELLGLDVFDPVAMQSAHRRGNDVPAWLLDEDYNELCFHVSQAFFPRTGAWDNLKRALKGDYDEAVWDHLAGTVSAPFEAGEHRQIAVKVIDDRGNELVVVKKLSEAR